jgi:NAD+ synthase (glutamine-hydrolysing)
VSQALNVAVCQINPTLGSFKSNIEKISLSYKNAIDNGADLVVFPEMSITGYPPQDLLSNNQFIKRNLECLNQFSSGVTKPCILGFVDYKSGKKFNSAAVCHDGEIVYKYDKIHLPNYDVFDERRYFTNGDLIGIFSININQKDYKIGLQICEDLWEDDYERKISEELIQLKPDLIVNISASPFAHNRKDERAKLIQEKFKNAGCPFIYCNLVGGQDELIFDGFSMIFDKNMNLIEMANGFEEQILLTDLKNSKLIPSSSSEKQLYDALSLGIKDYFAKTGHKKAVIGLSGGIDSALVACLAVEALGSDNVYLVSMPSRFSSNHSKTDAKMLAEKLNSNYQTIDIDELFEKYLDVLKPSFKGLKQNVAEENIQSRIRGNILMALSNKFGCLVLSTGNKTELALGYCTLYGDMSGGLSAIGDLNKTEVFKLSKWINRNEEIIPINIINKTPSAELAPDQFDPFDYEAISPVIDQIVLDNSDSENKNQEFLDLKKKVNINEHKRRQAAPVLRVSRKAFGIGRRIPIVNHFHE